ncbi:hypothetical protein [Paenirhodobacter populi]|uniref:Uncharacterized protein n=1 Tax=Paenirhodobacter populi TaxID=2306993 RepID=A0A443JAQ8_9RHOB|nr:hypothetical protein [Sinirhodobacter populi]RWR17479.1 hypothetical protein D2T30_18915 [Sinirhodobacter populi]
MPFAPLYGIVRFLASPLVIIALCGFMPIELGTAAAQSIPTPTGRSNARATTKAGNAASIRAT